MAVAITRTADPVGVAADGSNNSTYSAQSTGTASPDRVIAVAIGKEVATTVVNSVTLDSGDGVGAVNMLLANGTTFASMGAWIYLLSVPFGTTASVVVKWSGAIASTANHITLYALTDAGVPPKSSGSNSSTDMDVTAPLTTGSVAIPTNGGILLVAVGATDTVAKTWVNATADLEEDAGDMRFTTAKSVVAGTVTITCTGGTNAEDGAMAWAIFEKAAIPDLVTSPYQSAFRR